MCRFRCHLTMPTGHGLDTHMAPGLPSATTDITFATPGTPSPLLLTVFSTAMGDDPCHSLLFYPEFLCFSFFPLSTTHFAVPQTTSPALDHLLLILFSTPALALQCGVFHRGTAQSQSEVASGGHLVQPSAQSRANLEVTASCSGRCPAEY